MAEFEMWKPIAHHKGYEVSNFGRVRSLDRLVTSYRTGPPRNLKGRILKQFVLWNGYKTTHLGKEHPQKYVHKLVASAFLGKCPYGWEVCHNNGNKHDNRLSNLRYDTRAANVADRVKHRAKDSNQTA